MQLMSIYFFSLRVCSNKGMLGLFRSNKSESGKENEDTWVEGRSVKYSAARLKEKGVLVSIEGVTEAQ